MTGKMQDRSGEAQQQPQHSGHLPLSRAEVIEHLSSCLALVRPAGMTEDAATEWLAVASQEVANMRPSTFIAACGEARRECTHHGQIVPKILNGKASRAWYDMGMTPFLPGPKPAKLIEGEALALIENAARNCRP